MRKGQKFKRATYSFVMVFIGWFCPGVVIHSDPEALWRSRRSTDPNKLAKWIVESLTRS
jgi:hypothetical protein